MKYVFWQNVISIHQSAFIKSLAEEYDVTLVVQEIIDAQRIKEQWNIPSMGKAHIVVNPTKLEINRLLSQPNIEHVFSGINAFPMVHQAFKGAISRGLSVSVMAEPYQWSGIKGWLRKLMYNILFIRYGHYIKHFFATGNMGIKCYLHSGFPASKLHHWGYFTEQNLDYEFKCPTTRKVKLIFVGRLDKNKNILTILNKFDEYDDNVEYFTIVGDGPLMKDVVDLAKNNDKIKILGRLNNETTCKIMREHDYLILPSIYDGWGAVINEALSQGTRVLCSDGCGAGILLDGKIRGEVYSPSSVIDILNKHCQKGPLTISQKEEIKQWAATHISGGVAANYFNSIIMGKYMTAPWID